MKKITFLLILTAIIQSTTFSQLGYFMIGDALAKKNQTDTVQYDHCKNLIEIQPSEFALYRFGISYERMLSSYFTIKVPIIIGFAPNPNSLMVNNAYINNSFGVQGLFFPLKHKFFSYFAGLSLRAGIVKSQNSRTYFNGYYTYTESYYEDLKFFLPEILNGFRVNLGQHFSLTSTLGIGFLKKDDPYGVKPHVSAQFGMGIKF